MQEMQETWVLSLGQEDLLEEEMAPHSCILARKIPWTDEPGGLQSTGLQSWTRISMHLHTYWEEGCVYLIHTNISSELSGDLPSFWEFLEIHTRWKEQRSFHSIMWTNYSLRMFCTFPHCSVAHDFLLAWNVFASSLSSLLTLAVQSEATSKFILNIIFMKLSCHLVADTL